LCGQDVYTYLLVVAVALLLLLQAVVTLLQLVVHLDHTLQAAAVHTAEHKSGLNVHVLKHRPVLLPSNHDQTSTDCVSSRHIVLLGVLNKRYRLPGRMAAGSKLGQKPTVAAILSAGCPPSSLQRLTV
jgi:hypothetical protein